MIYILIPVLNEEENIAPLILNLDSSLNKIGEGYVLIFVNDGSIDKTPEVIRDEMGTFPIELLENRTNQGPGRSFDKGFRFFLTQAKDGDILVTIEGDNTSDSATIVEMIQTIREGKDFVLASCYAKRGKMVRCPPGRRFLSICANFLCRLVLGIKGVRTYSSFYRAYSHKTIKQLYAAYGDQAITENGYLCMVELLMKCNNLGLRFSEVPTTVLSFKRKGFSKLRIRKTTGSYFRLFGKHLFSRKFYHPRVNPLDIPEDSKTEP